MDVFPETDSPAPPAPGDGIRLRCPYGCGGELWTSDEGAECVEPRTGGAVGCGASWDAVGYPVDVPTGVRP